LFISGLLVWADAGSAPLAMPVFSVGVRKRLRKGRNAGQRDL